MTISEATAITRRIRVGRADDNDVVVQDPLVSRHHMELVRWSDGWLVTDLGSGNGTLLNGRPVRSEAVAEGTILSVGSTRLRLTTYGIEVLDSSAETAIAAAVPAPPVMQPGSVVNGHRLSNDGSRWEPMPPQWQAAPHASPAGYNYGAAGTSMGYLPGDVANGHQLGSDGVLQPLGGQPSKHAWAVPILVGLLVIAAILAGLLFWVSSSAKSTDAGASATGLEEAWNGDSFSSSSSDYEGFVETTWISLTSAEQDKLCYDWTYNPNVKADYINGWQSAAPYGYDYDPYPVWEAWDRLFSQNC